MKSIFDVRDGDLITRDRESKDQPPGMANLRHDCLLSVDLTGYVLVHHEANAMGSGAELSVELEDGTICDDETRLIRELFYGSETSAASLVEVGKRLQSEWRRKLQ